MKLVSPEQKTPDLESKCSNERARSREQGDEHSGPSFGLDTYTQNAKLF
jgi:hypothetical protein